MTLLDRPYAKKTDRKINKYEKPESTFYYVGITERADLIQESSLLSCNHPYFLLHESHLHMILFSTEENYTLQHKYKSKARKFLTSKESGMYSGCF